MNDTITISRDEYARLCEAAEDLDDLRAYDRAKADLDAGEDELLPEEAVRRIVAGESPLRIYRELRSYTQEELGARSGVNRVQIADIEAKRKSGSLATVKKLAGALGVQIDDLVA